MQTAYSSYTSVLDMCWMLIAKASSFHSNARPMASCLPVNKEKVSVIMCTKNVKASDWLRSYKEVLKNAVKIVSNQTQ